MNPKTEVDVVIQLHIAFEFPKTPDESMDLFKKTEPALTSLLSNISIITEEEDEWYIQAHFDIDAWENHKLNYETFKNSIMMMEMLSENQKNIDKTLFPKSIISNLLEDKPQSNQFNGKNSLGVGNDEDEYSRLMLEKELDDVKIQLDDLTNENMDLKKKLSDLEEELALHIKESTIDDANIKHTIKENTVLMHALNSTYYKYGSKLTYIFLTEICQEIYNLHGVDEAESLTSACGVIKSELINELTKKIDINKCLKHLETCGLTLDQIINGLKQKEHEKWFQSFIDTIIETNELIVTNELHEPERVGLLIRTILKKIFMTNENKDLKYTFVIIDNKPNKETLKSLKSLKSYNEALKCF